MRIPFLYLLVFLAFIPSIAICEEVDARTCRILYHSAAAGAPKTLQLYDGESCNEVKLPRMNLSEIHKLRKGRLNLRMLSEAITDPLAVPKGAPSVIVPEDFQHIYLLVSHDPKNKVVPVKMEVINANYDEIKPGQMLWINDTKSTVSGMIGSRELLIKPSERVLIKEPAEGQKNCSVKIAYSASNNGDFRSLSESRWSHDSRSRSLVFIVEDSRRKIPRVLTFSDFRILEKK